MNTIVCVLKSGGDFNWNYVVNIYDNIRKNLAPAIEWELVVLTDMPFFYKTCPTQNFRILPLKHNLRGWWSKMEIFRRDLAVGGDIFYFDLDTIIVKDITHFITHKIKTNIIMLKDLLFPEKLASGIMWWSTDVRRFIWDIFSQNMKAAFDYEYENGGGDQAWLEKIITENGLHVEKWQDWFQDQIVSYKVQKCQHQIPEHARIICFHGLPRPHQVNGWVSDYFVKYHH